MADGSVPRGRVPWNNLHRSCCAFPRAVRRRRTRHDRVVTGPPYVPVDGRPWHLSMGLHRLDPDRWLEVDGQRESDLRRKARLLDEAHDTVVATLPGSERASAELLRLVVGYLSTHHAALLGGDWQGPGPVGTVIDATAGHAVVTASLLVQEDLCVLEHDDGTWRLTAACVCFPSRWSLTEKLGQSLDGIHGPVPGFNAALLGPATTFFDRLTVDRPVWRANWTLLETDELHLPTASGRLAGWSEGDLGSSLWFRVERQTLRRLPLSGAVVFTIRTYVRPLRDVADTSPGFALALRDTMRTVTPDVAAYKGWVGLLEPLDRWLATWSHDD